MIITVPLGLLEALVEVAVAAQAFDDAQPDRSWRLADPAGQALHDALTDLDGHDGWEARLREVLRP